MSWLEKIKNWEPDYKAVSLWPKNGQILLSRVLFGENLQKLAA
jgi:hypothetical protein